MSWLLAAIFAVIVAPLAVVAAPLPLWTDPATGMKFILVPGGSFLMGSPPDEPGHEAQEVRHRVTLTRSFWLGRTEVTQGEWEHVMGANPSHFKALGERAPVEDVTWYDVQDFLARLSALSPGNRFRLPTEAEWEYACRAGTTTAYPTGEYIDTDHANYCGRFPLPGQRPGLDRERPTPVASFPPNPWGLYDMNGNVWEWTADEHCPYPDRPVRDPHPSCGAKLKVIRGGSWYFNADSARCAVRYTHPPQDKGFSLGFRVVREPAGSGEGE